MIRRLQDPFQSVELPETIEEYLEHGTAGCTAFNRRGTLLAAGTEEGEVVIWDFETHSVAKSLKGHNKAVTCIAWSRNGQKLLSGSLDSTLYLWDVLSGTQEGGFTLDTGILGISANKCNYNICVATLQCGLPVLVDFSEHKATTLPSVAPDSDSSRGRDTMSDLTTPVALFNKDGNRIFAAHPKGWLVVYNCSEKSKLTVMDVIKVPQTNRILGLHANKKGSLLLVNCSDRVIRMFTILEMNEDWEPDFKGLDCTEVASRISKKTVPKSGSLLWKSPLLEPQHEFMNPVERTQWQCMSFSTDSEYVVVGAQARSEHLLYIWSTVLGKLEKILEGPKDGVKDITWHPLRSSLLSVSKNGKVYIWAKIYTENWSAFAPDFQELEENQEYIEQETEFDLNDMPPRKQRRIGESATDQEDGMDVDDACGSDYAASFDIFGVEEVNVFSSDDEVDDQLHHLPVEVMPRDAPGSPQSSGDMMNSVEHQLPPKKAARSARTMDQSTRTEGVSNNGTTHNDLGDADGLKARPRRPAKWHSDYIETDDQTAEPTTSRKSSGTGPRRSRR